MTSNMIKSLGLICLGLTLTSAFPQLNANTIRALGAQGKSSKDCPYSGMNHQAKRQATFDPSTQYVSTTGKYAWVAPDFALGDQRGPCPGLNALANHG